MFFFILFHNYFFCYEGKHQCIQQNLTYPTEEKNRTQKKRKQNRENKTTDKERTHNFDSFSAGKNTSS